MLCQMARWSEMAVALPTIVERLMDLKNVVFFFSISFDECFDKCSGVLTRMRSSYSVCVGCLSTSCAYAETNFNIKYVMANRQKNGLRKKDLERKGTCTG